MPGRAADADRACGGGDGFRASSASCAGAFALRGRAGADAGRLGADRGRGKLAGAPEEEDVLDLAEKGGQQQVEPAEEETLIGGLREPDAALPQGPGEVWLRFGLLRDGVHGGGLSWLSVMGGCSIPSFRGITQIVCHVCYASLCLADVGGEVGE